MNAKADVVVEVVSNDVQERKGEFTNDKGEQVKFETRKQEARLHVNGFVYPYDVRLENGQPAFPPGRYRMALEKMITVNKGNHGIARFPVLEQSKA